MSNNFFQITHLHDHNLRILGSGIKRQVAVMISLEIKKNEEKEKKQKHNIITFTKII